jgi:hypothetical protein
VHDNPDPVLAALVSEMRKLLEEVRSEREQLFEIVIQNGDLPTLHRIANLFDARQRAIH